MLPTFFLSNYNALKTCVEKNGEVMIRTDTGEKIELHKLNVKFDDSIKEIVVRLEAKLVSVLDFFQ